MDDEILTRVAKALADPVRLKMFRLIRELEKDQRVNCSMVTDCLPVSQSTCSHHIHELESAGLIKIESEGRTKYLSSTGRLSDFAENLSDL